MLKRIRIGLMSILAAVVMAVVVLGRPVVHIGLSAWNDRNELQPLPLGVIDDASRLNQTSAIIKAVPNEPNAAIQMLRSALKAARSTGKKVSIAGARHTMGGHTIYKDGLAIDLSGFKQMALDEQTNILQVGSGARWEDIIPYLNERGRSVAVMQSNNDFSVGGTMSANAHGWQHNSRPFGSTVESFRLMLADGSIVRCSRRENAQLFSLVLGGYGLFGVILDVNLRVVANEMYRAERVIVSSQNYVNTFASRVNGVNDIGMAYGRISVAPDRFLKEAMLTIYRRNPDLKGTIPPLTASAVGLTRPVFRGEVESDYGKNLRWQLEKAIGGEAGNSVSRNQILNRSSTLLENRKQAATDILHEYFIPPQSVGAFLEKCRTIIPQYKGDLLNITVRNVQEDHDSFLRYADQELFGLVMLFHQRRTADAEVKMQAMTQALVEAALSVGGKHYLPYRLHATPEQFSRAYPQERAFFALKRRYDPEQLFQNQFYLKYGQR